VKKKTIFWIVAILVAWALLNYAKRKTAGFTQPAP
jgi:hypothetical protein